MSDPLSGASVRYTELYHLRFALEQVPEPPNGRPACPHCHGTHVHGWGTFAGRPRYRCLGCRRTYTALTGTPLARLKYRDRWARLGWCLLEGKSVRASAVVLEVHPFTAFRWRHRFLAAVRDHLEPQLRREGGLLGLATLWTYRNRFLEWGRRFHGVSARYYRNYLAWFTVVDRLAGVAPSEALPELLSSFFGGTSAQPRRLSGWSTPRRWEPDLSWSASPGSAHPSPLAAQQSRRTEAARRGLAWRGRGGDGGQSSGSSRVSSGACCWAP
jgi:transposase-like protein